MLDADRTRYAASKAALAKNDMSFENPQRERGLWSFLTWSFFLSQIAAGNAFAGGAAQAAHDIDNGSTGSANGAGVVPANPLGTSDIRSSGSDDTQSSLSSGSTGPVQSGPSATGPQPGAVERLDLPSDANAAPQQFAMHGDGAPAAGGLQPDVPPEVGPGAELPPIAEVPPDIGLPPILGDLLPPLLADGLPPILGDLLPPVLGSVDDLIDGLGPSLDGILVPVVETVEDLANVLGPILDDVLSPVEALVDGAVDALAPTVEAILTPVEGVTDIVSDLIEPVADGVEPILALADPLVDSVGVVVDAAAPILDPILDVAAPVVDLVQPIAEPILKILPFDLAKLGLLGDGVDAVAAPGQLVFAEDVGSPIHELFQADGYTEYGLALQETPVGNEGGAGDLLGNIAIPIDVLLGDDEDAGNHPPGLLGHLQHEAGLRGLGDGLI